MGIAVLFVVDNERLYVYLSTWLSIRGTTQRERVESPCAQYFLPSLRTQLHMKVDGTATASTCYEDKGSDDSFPITPSESECLHCSLPTAR